MKHKSKAHKSSHLKYLLSTAISFSRLRSLFCFFFTHFMAKSFPVFFSFTMYTSENAPLIIDTQTHVLLTVQLLIAWKDHSATVFPSRRKLVFSLLLERGPGQHRKKDYWPLLSRQIREILHHTETEAETQLKKSDGN